MNINFPPISDVRAELDALSHAEVQELSRISGVPFTTLWKIRGGVTTNPGIETVRLFYRHIKSVKPAATDKAGA